MEVSPEKIQELNRARVEIADVLVKTQLRLPQ
jgi:hypothetical protein